nr:hypothetical protein [Candidatus Anoxychlamydiales bacterium]
SFKHTKPSWDGHEFGFVEWLKDVDVSSIVINGTKLDTDGTYTFTKGEIPKDLINLVKDTSVFLIDYKKAKTNFEKVIVTITGGIVDIQILFTDNPTILNQNEIMTQDPTLGFSLTSQRYQSVSEASVDTSCLTTSHASTGGTSIRIRLSASTVADGCDFPAPEWDISSIDDDATSISQIRIKYNVTSVLNPRSCEYRDMTNQPSGGASNDAKLADIRDGTIFGTDSQCTSTGEGLIFTMNSDARTDLASRLVDDWWGFGITFDDDVRNTSQHRVDWDELKVELEVTYSVATITTIGLRENDNSTAITSADFTIVNSTGTFTTSPNSTGFVVETFDDNIMHNFTTKELTDNYVVNKTLNYDSDIARTIFIPTLIFSVDCASTGAGDDVNIKVNDTDGHYITVFSTPTCDSNDDISWSVTWSSLDFDPTSYSSTMLAEILNNNFKRNSDSFTADSVSITTSYSDPKITSNSFDVDIGSEGETIAFVLSLDDGSGDVGSAPSGGGGGGGGGAQPGGAGEETVIGAIPLLSLTDIRHVIPFEATREYQILITWPTLKNLEIVGIDVNLLNAGAIQVTAQSTNPSFMLEGTPGANADTPSSGFIMYKVETPPRCTPTNVNNCADPILYSIPITVQAIHGGEGDVINSEIILLIDLREQIDYSTITILLLTVAGIIFMVRFVIKQTRKGKRGRKRAIKIAKR